MPTDDEKKAPETPKSEPKGDSKPETDAGEKKPAENSENQAENSKSDEPKAEETTKEEPKQEQNKDNAKDDGNKLPELSEVDQLKAENFALKTQIEAIKIGFLPDVLEDAVALAENIVKRDGSDSTTALQSIAKKYPDWKADSNDKNSKKGSFKLGADSNADKNKANQDKLDAAFGVKSK